MFALNFLTYPHNHKLLFRINGIFLLLFLHLDFFMPLRYTFRGQLSTNQAQIVKISVFPYFVQFKTFCFP